MSAPHRNNYSALWKAQSAKLNSEGYFSDYPPDRRDEVLRKGYLGPWPPDRAIAITMQLVEKGTHIKSPELNDDMRDHYGILFPGVRDALLDLLRETPPQAYKPPRELKDPPGYPFIFASRTLRSEVYFKFQLLGTDRKPQVKIWSCHPPVYGV